MYLVCAANLLHSKKSSIRLEWGESTVAFQSPCIQVLLHESNKCWIYYFDGQQWFCCYQYAVYNKGQTCPLGSHSRFLPSTSYYMWSPYTMQHTWMPQMANRKANLEFSLSVVLTNKCCIDSFVYSALSINHFQRNLILHWFITCEKLL